jgi:hypothetical protein
MWSIGPPAISNVLNKAERNIPSAVSFGVRAREKTHLSLVNGSMLNAVKSQVSKCYLYALPFHNRCGIIAYGPWGIVDNDS